MGKQFLLWCALALSLAACGNDHQPVPYGYGLVGGGGVTNPPNNFLGGVCGLNVANDYNALASACNQQMGYGRCEHMAYGFLRRYPGINCTIQTTQGQMLTLNESTIRMLLGNRGMGPGFQPNFGQVAPPPPPAY